jgi:hypothetical protein
MRGGADSFTLGAVRIALDSGTVVSAGRRRSTWAVGSFRDNEALVRTCPRPPLWWFPALGLVESLLDDEQLGARHGRDAMSWLTSRASSPAIEFRRLAEPPTHVVNG